MSTPTRLPLWGGWGACRYDANLSIAPATRGNNNSTTKFSMSANGRYVALESTANNLVAGDTNGYSDVFVRDNRGRWQPERHHQRAHRLQCGHAALKLRYQSTLMASKVKLSRSKRAAKTFYSLAR